MQKEGVVSLIASLPTVFSRFSRTHRANFLAIVSLGRHNVPLINACYAFVPRRVPVTTNTIIISLYSASSRAVRRTRGSLPHGLYPLVGDDCNFNGASGYPCFCFSSLIINRAAYSNGGGVCRCVTRFGPIRIVRLPGDIGSSTSHTL